MFVLLPVSSLAAETVASGTDTNKNITWTLDSEGTLTFVGSGEIGSLYKSLSTDVKKAVIEEGITSVAPYLFQDFFNLTEVIIPEGGHKNRELRFQRLLKSH